MFQQRVIIVFSLLYCFILTNTSEETKQTVTLEGREGVYSTCSNVNLTCRITHNSGEDSQPIFWHLNGTNVTLGNRITTEHKNCKSSPSSQYSSRCDFLYIKCAEEIDSGIYSCGVLYSDNVVISSNNSLVLNVREPVKVVNDSGNVIVKLGSAGVELWCEFSGVGAINGTWSLKNNEGLYSIPNSQSPQNLENGNWLSKLILKDVKDKNGTYVCNGSDENFHATREISVFVLSAPVLKLDKVFAIGAHTVFMNWTINDGNSPITKYLIQKQVYGSTEWTYYEEEIPVKNTSTIIKNLEPKTKYLFKIQAVNNVSSGSDNIFEPVTTFEDDLDFVPEVNIRGSGPQSINIGWTVPLQIHESRSHVYLYKVVMRDKTNTKTETIVDGMSSYPFTNLESASNYFFQVAVCNKYSNECGKWSKVVNGTTLDGEAGLPENVNITCRYDSISRISSVYASWSPPKNPNGEIVYYNVALLGNANYPNEKGEPTNATFGPKVKTSSGDSNYTSFENVLPNTNYTIGVSAITRSRGGGKTATRECSMPPTVPDKDDLKFDWDKVEDQGRWYFRLSKPKLSERNGEICCFRVCIVKLKPEERTEELADPEKATITSYKSVHETGSGTYIADVFDKNAIDKNKDILLGDEHFTINFNHSKCNKCPFNVSKTSSPIRESPSNNSVRPNSTNLQYDNYRTNTLFASSNANSNSKSEGVPFDGVLDMHSNYTGFIVIMVDGKDKFIPAYSSYFRILKPGPQPLDASQATEFAAILFEILCGTVVISIMMLAAFCLLQHYTKQVAEAQGVEMTLRNSFRYWCRSLRGSHLPVSSNPPDVLPISKTALLTTFAELAKDSDYGFEQEFDVLPDKLADRTTKASEARENACKNRYPDIKAYDQTRVKLSQVDGIIGSDYINANFVVSYKERKKFICAQGPMENTVCDFWRMIWEQHLEIVLMLTNLEEYSKTKCAKYWPDKEEEKKTYADITIYYINERRYSDYVVRQLKMVRTVAQNRDPEERSIFQYHFLMWKDFQAPEHPSALLKFIRRVNEAYSLEKGPILVHCSAGVGRTGTLVAIDSLLQQLDSEGQVLIFNTIYDLRRQRNFLVQSLKQYIFVYRALVEYAQFGITEIKAKHLKATVEKLKQCDNGKTKTRMEEEYEKLSFTVSTYEHKSSSVGTVAENAPKNRSTAVIPFDKNRVILTPIPGRDHSTYINASFIEGYDNSESFVITQDPILDVTVVDFWRMISEQNISTIVMLSSTSSDGQKKTGRYWPDDETVHGNVNVKHIQSESCPYYTRREFYISNLKTEENLVVTQYQYNGWPTVEGEVPEVTRGLIELMDHATQHADSIGPAPIVVHCEFGTDRSSMFVALSILAQQLKVERRVDVVTSARKLRSQRQGMLSSFAQYEFLYRAILNYVDLHHLSDSDTE